MSLHKQPFRAGEAGRLLGASFWGWGGVLPIDTRSMHGALCRSPDWVKDSRLLLRFNCLKTHCQLPQIGGVSAEHPNIELAKKFVRVFPCDAMKTRTDFLANP